jgi:predicted dehydrogenase
LTSSRDEFVLQAPLGVSSDFRPMRVGIVGVGVHAVTAILPNLPSAGMQLTATCARHRDRAAEVALRFGAKHAFDDVGRMLRETELDGVIVVVPPDQFFDVLMTCIDAGVPVLAEKPGANDEAEAMRLAAAATAGEVLVMVGYMKRFASAYQRSKELMSQPEFGSPTLASFTWAMGPLAHRFNYREWLFENPVHHFDLARYLFGELTEFQVARRDGHEHTVVVTARSSSGALVNIRASTTGSWQQRMEAVEIFGLGHSLFVENHDTCIYRPMEGPEHVWRPNYTRPIASNMTGATMGFLNELVHFRAAVLDGVPCISDISSGAATLAVAGAVANATA